MAVRRVEFPESAREAIRTLAQSHRDEIRQLTDAGMLTVHGDVEALFSDLLS